MSNTPAKLAPARIIRRGYDCLSCRREFDAFQASDRQCPFCGSSDVDPFRVVSSADLEAGHPMPDWDMGRMAR